MKLLNLAAYGPFAFNALLVVYGESISWSADRGMHIVDTHTYVCVYMLYVYMYIHSS